MGLRAASPADDPFLLELSSDRRRAELAAFGWPEDEMTSFLDLQHRAQRLGYLAAYPEALDWIILDAGEPVGHLLLDRRPAVRHIVDVAVLTRCRGRGIGTAVLRAVLADATLAGVPAQLTVALAAPRLISWYERLGFRVVERDELSATMVAGA